MRETVTDVAFRLAEITGRTPVDWAAFDAALMALEDINACDVSDEETILSELIMCGNFYKRGAVLPELVRHFLACGYDVSAHEGLNGGLALSALCWSSYDRYLLDAAKVLLNAGAPVRYHSQEDEPGEVPEGLLGSIGWKISGAWAVDRDYWFANTLEAYYAMAEASLAGKDYSAIADFSVCIGRPLTAVSAVRGSGAALRQEGAAWAYDAGLVLWFDGWPLIASCYVDLVVNPVYAAEQRANLATVSDAFSPLIGAVLEDVRYLDAAICYFAFSGGKRLFLASREIGNRTRTGTAALCAAPGAVQPERLHVDSICGWRGVHFADTVTDYGEEALALFCGDAAYLLSPRGEADGRASLEFIPCPKALLAEYTRRYPLRPPMRITCAYERGALSALRLDSPDGHLYLRANTYPEIELRVLDEQRDPMDEEIFRYRVGRHVEFWERKE